MVGTTTEHVMMALGEYRFALATAPYQRMTRQIEARWSAQARIGREPAHQYLGQGVETIALEGVVYPAHRGGLRQVEEMKEQARRGEPLMMTDGTGFVWGRWVIRSIRETRQVFFADGAPRAIEFSADLAFYGEDRA